MRLLAFIFSSLSLFAAISDVEFYAYQLQGLDETSAIDDLVASRYDMLVLEPVNTEIDMDWFDTADMVAQCKASPGNSLSNKIVVAYINIGEAEDWRFYWESWWEPPTLTGPGVPDFMIAADPDGWEGDYPVAYWNPAWQDIVINNDNSLLRRAIADGFDGIYMDWVGGYEEPTVIARAAADGVDPVTAMIDFIHAIRDTARRYNPDFLVIAQNGADIAEAHPEYYGLIDAIAQEDLHFGGDSDSDWGDPDAGDIPQDTEYTEYLIEHLNGYRAHELPVFVVEYSLIPANYNAAYDADILLDYIPFITQTPLDRLPNYFPTGYGCTESPSLPTAVTLNAYPNPFNSAVEIRYNIPETHCDMTITTLDGRRVGTFPDLSGSGCIVWEPKGLPGGVYLVRVGGVGMRVLYVK